jgi:hypothetical protein
MSNSTRKTEPGLDRDAVVRALGLNPDQATWRLIKSVSTEREQREVLLLDHTDRSSLVVKHEPRGSEEHFAQLLGCYRALEGATKGSRAFHMAPLVWADSERQILVLDHVPGLTAYARLQASEIELDTRADVLCQCGAWLRHLHSETSVVQFDGNGMLRRVRRFAQRIRNAEHEAAYPKKFLGICAFMHQLMRAADGAACKYGLRHGDAHSRNFIFGRDGLYSIDPLPRGDGPVALDVARFMTRLGYSFGVERAGERGLAGLNAADWVAFGSGYGQPCQDDPVLHVFFCHQLFNDWLQIPAKKELRAQSEQRRIERILMMFQTLRDQLGRD